MQVMQRLCCLTGKQQEYFQFLKNLHKDTFNQWHTVRLKNNVAALSLYQRVRLSVSVWQRLFTSNRYVTAWQHTVNDLVWTQNICFSC